jgi:DNA-binding beta-propeller fold protein YncE
MMQKILLYIGMIILVFSCIDDESIYEKKRLDVDSDPELKAYITNQRGVFIVNEGNFMYDNASLSYYLIDSMKVLNNLFERVNGLPLGDVAHSMTIHNGLGYIVINNSGKIYIIDIHSFKLVGKITGLVSPRYIFFISDTKAYITDLYAKAITIVNPQTYLITGSISVNNHETRFYQHPTEQMVQIGEKIFVNCWSYDNKILVIDSKSDVVTDSIDVISQPKSMVVDQNNKLWVLSDGGAEGNPYAFERPGITRIDPETMEIERIFRFDLNDNPLSLCLNMSRDTLFWVNQHIWKMAVTSSNLPTVPIIKSQHSADMTGGFSSLAIDPVNYDVYVADALDNVQHGLVYRYSVSGIAIDTFQTGIIPGAFCYKP